MRETYRFSLLVWWRSTIPTCCTQLPGTAGCEPNSKRASPRHITLRCHLPTDRFIRMGRRVWHFNTVAAECHASLFFTVNKEKISREHPGKPAPDNIWQHRQSTRIWCFALCKMTCTTGQQEDNLCPLCYAKHAIRNKSPLSQFCSHQVRGEICILAGNQVKPAIWVFEKILS